MGLIDLPLTDLGGVPLVYDTVGGVIKQSEEWVAKHAPSFKPNYYGPGDVFRDRSGGLVAFDQAFALALQTSNALRGARPGQPEQTTPYVDGYYGGQAAGPVIRQPGALETTINNLVELLRRPVWPNDPRSWPTWYLVAGGAAIYLLARKRRR